MNRFGLWMLLCFSTTTAFSADWPQFRGPDGQGHATATNLPQSWSEHQNIAWKSAIAGKGWSSPVIQGNQVWLTTAVDSGKSLRAICLDRRSGKIEHDVEVFSVVEPPPVNAKNSYASPTPVIEQDRLFVNYGALGTACLDTKTARIVWKNEELKLDHKEGAGSSPMLWRDLLIINCDGTDVQFVVALDKRTGKIVWKNERPGPISDTPDFRKAYSTPLVIRTADRDELISTGAHQVIAYDPANGESLWRVGYDGFSNVPRPVFGDGRLFICTGYNRPQLWALDVHTGRVTDQNILWKMTKQVPANPSPLLVDDSLYMVSDQGIATCLEAKTGKEVWKERLPGNYSASLLFADGCIYFASEQGAVSIVQPGATYKLLATNQLDGRIMASPIAVDQALYIRTDTHLYRIEKAESRTAQRPALRSGPRD